MSRVERILYNGNIRTLNSALPGASALAIAGGKIVALGSDEYILRLADATTARDDLHGLTVLPGFTDSHIHFQKYAASLCDVQLYNLPDKAAALARVAERVQVTPRGQWIVGYGWAQDEWTERSFPTAADLDTVAPDHPLFLWARSGHAGWVNTLALRLCGVDGDTPDPVGGSIQRDANGQPTGILFEWAAMNLVKDRIPLLTVDQLADQMDRAQVEALSLGITGIHDFDDQDCFAAFQILRERGELSLRVLKNINKWYLDSMLHMGLRQGFGDDWIRLGALKIFADGALGPRTAYMLQPYEGEPDNFGVVVTDKEEMVELVSRASAAGFASTVHAIGDRAVRDVLDVFVHVRGEEAAAGIPRKARRHRIEHVQLIHPHDLDRLAQLEVIASMQPIHAMSDQPMADRYWGARSAYSYNPRLQLDRGVTVAFGSDAPVDSADPWAGIHAAVTRQRPDGTPEGGWYPEARLSLDEALHGYTIGAAYAAGIDDHAGKLAPGFLADAVVVNTDPYSVPTEELHAIRVVSSLVGGVWRWGEFAR